MLVRRTVRICNPAGLHARPCHALVCMALEHEAELTVSSGGQKVNGRSILELITLSAPCGTKLHLEARGADAEALIAGLVALVESGFAETD